MKVVTTSDAKLQTQLFEFIQVMKLTLHVRPVFSELFSYQNNPRSTLINILFYKQSYALLGNQWENFELKYVTVYTTGNPMNVRGL